MGVAISSGEELEAWLEGKPRDWALAIALRCALRVLPHICDPVSFGDRSIDPRLPLAVFRASAILSGAIKTRTNDVSHSATAAARFSAVDAYAGAISSEALHYFAYAALRTAGAAVRSVYASSAAEAARAASDAAEAAFARSTVSTTDKYVAGLLFEGIVQDCRWLSDNRTIRTLLAEPLWLDRRPEILGAIRERASEWLDDSPDGFVFWRQWYDRKLRGERFEFAYLDEGAEIEFFSRLFAQDDAWWNREPATVNAEIAGWVAELARPKPSQPDDLFTDRSTDFFISYSHKDEAKAREVADVLDELGKTYVVQYRDFPQRNFVQAMNEGLGESKRLIALYSSDYVGSDHCNAEWNYFYNRDPSSASRLIVPFKLDDADLKPLMAQIVYRDLSQLRGAGRRDAIREWIAHEPPAHSRDAIAPKIVQVLSPQIVVNEDEKLDTAPDPVFDQPEHPAELVRAMAELRMMLDVMRGDAVRNLSHTMQQTLSAYDEHFSRHGAKSSWNGLDRYIAIITDGFGAMSDDEFSPGQKAALEQLIAAHKQCMATLKNADLALRDLASIPLDGANPENIRDFIKQMGTFFDALKDHDKTTERLDKHIAELTEQGRDFAHEAGASGAEQKAHHAMRRYLLYAGGVAITTLNVVGSMASVISGWPAIVVQGQSLVDAFYRLTGL